MKDRIKDSEVVTNDYGEFLRIGRDYWGEDAKLVSDYIARCREAVRGPKKISRGFSADVAAALSKGKMLFFDIENYGFGGSSHIFTIALGMLDKGARTEVLFARDPSEEMPMLHYFIELLNAYKKANDCEFVTYNGDSFDLVKLSERARQNGFNSGSNGSLKELIDGQHVDLLKIFRKIKGELGLPDVKLKTLERMLLDYTRIGDISSRAIPQAYHEYLYGRTAQGKHIDEEQCLGKMERIIHHNEIDVLTMMALVIYLRNMDFE